MIGPEEQKMVENCPTYEQLDKEFFKTLMEGALISPFGTECCQLEGFPET